MDYKKLWLELQTYLAKNPEQETLHKSKDSYINKQEWREG